MKNSKLISLLGTFTGEEINQFKDFVNSPYFNNRQNVTELLNLVSRHFKKVESGELTKERLFDMMYRNQKYNDDLMRNLISHLYILAEKFLSQKGFEEEIVIGKKYLLRQLTDRGQFKSFEKNLKAAREFINRSNTLNGNYYLWHYYLETELIRWLNRSKSTPFLPEDNAQEIADNLINFFLISSLGIYTYMINQSKNAYHYKFNMNFLDSILNFIKENDYEGIPYISMHYNSIQLLLTEKEEYFFRLKDVLFSHRNQFNATDTGNIYLFLNSFCYRKYTEGINKYIKIAFELFKDNITNNAYNSNGYFHHITFKNAVTCALRAEEYAWTEEFITKYNSELLEKHRLSTVNLCRAFLSFYQKKFSKAMDFLSKVSLEDISYKTDVKAITALVFYSINSYDSLISHIDTYKHFLKTNNSIPQRLRVTHLGFVNYLSKLVNLKENKDIVELKKLSKEAETSAFFVHKFWLLDEIKKILD